MEQIIDTIVHSIPGFLMAIVAHEWAHGRMALAFGDNTAQRMDRVTFNPIAHIDLFGTIIMPLICLAIGSMMFGWAKPVPIDTRKFRVKEFKKAIFWVSFAGPLANLTIGIISAFLFAWIATQVPQDFAFYEFFLKVLNFSVIINFLLGSFNLIPIPPLDGSKMVATFLKGRALARYESIQQYSFFIFIGIILLSNLGIPTISLFISPFIGFGQSVLSLFLAMMS